MASVKNRATSGISAGGAVTITGGTPIQISTLFALPPNAGGATNLTATPPFTLTAQQIIFSTGGNTGVVYVNYGNFAGLDAHATALIIPANSVQSLPNGSLCTEALIDVTKWWVDGTTSDHVAVSLVNASS